MGMLTHPASVSSTERGEKGSKRLDILLPCRKDSWCRCIRRKRKRRKPIPFRWTSISGCIPCIASRPPSLEAVSNNPVDYLIIKSHPFRFSFSRQFFRITDRSPWATTKQVDNSSNTFWMYINIVSNLLGTTFKKGLRKLTKLLCNNMINN
jgi:hypothetical protein